MTGTGKTDFATKIHDINGLKIALSTKESTEFSKFIAQMSVVPDLKSMIDTDQNGLITYFAPKDVSWGFVFFIQNLMISQRLQIFDELARKQGLIR